jgi:hypothetical protein
VIAEDQWRYRDSRGENQEPPSKKLSWLATTGCKSTFQQITEHTCYLNIVPLESRANTTPRYAAGPQSHITDPSVPVPEWTRSRRPPSSDSIGGAGPVGSLVSGPKRVLEVHEATTSCTLDRAKSKSLCSSVSILHCHDHQNQCSPQESTTI